MVDFDRSKSLQQLDGEDWGDPAYGSHLVTECHRLRRVPVRDFDAEALRILFGQNIGLRFLIPLALDMLRVEPFVAGDCYEGDLLAAVLRADSRFWLAAPELRALASQVAEHAFALLPQLEESDRPTAEESLSAAFDIFSRAEYFAQHGRA